MAVRRWPNLFLIGAPRSGTTTLHALLNQHPDVFMSTEKEPHFFVDSGLDHLGYVPIVTDENAYLDLFAGRSERVLGESSTAYLWNRDAPERIRAVSPGAKAVAILREPVERAHSHYLLFVREGGEARPFPEALRRDLAGEEPPPFVGFGRQLYPGARSLYVDAGRYCEQLRRWREVFGDDLLVLFYEEEARDDFRAAARKVFELVGVDPNDAQALEATRLNAYRQLRSPLARRVWRSRWTRRLPPALFRVERFRSLFLGGAPKPPLEPEARAVLEAEYAGEDECLRELLGRPVPWTQASSAPSSASSASLRSIPPA